MEVQIDYETELTLAVFRSSEQANEAISRVRAAGIRPEAIARFSLAPGRYQVEDDSLDEENHGARDGALLGAPLGAAAGAALGAALPGAGPTIAAGLAAAGAAEGALLGGFVGGIAHAHFDDDPAREIEVPADQQYALVIVRTGGGATSEKGRARAALRGAGAIGFIDASCYEATELQSGRLIPVSS